MTVTMTSEALGKKVGETYTGPEEAWLLAQGYAKRAGYTGPGVAGTGPSSSTPAQDVTDDANREAPKWPATDETNWSIANDADHLTKEPNPAPPDYDFDNGGVNDDKPGNLKLSPTSGPAVGGTIVGLSGSSLTDTTTVTVGGANVNEVYVKAGDRVVRIDFAVPAHAAGAVDVVVTNSVGATTMTGGFTYTA